VNYAIDTNVTVNYDANLIKSSDNKILKAEGLQMKIEGDDSSPFVIDDDSPKIVTFYIRNDNTTRTSGVLEYTGFTVWNTEHRTEGDGVENIYETGAPCEFLEPGETKEIGTYQFSKDSWPIARDGIAENLDSETAVPGIYISFFQVFTRSCSLPNEEVVPGSTHTMFAAFEVRP